MFDNVQNNIQCICNPVVVVLINFCLLVKRNAKCYDKTPIHRKKFFAIRRRGGFRSPFDTFSEIHFWPTDPKILLKAPSAPIYTNFEGERAPKKKRVFLSKFFKKCPKFFKNLPAAQKILP